MPISRLDPAATALVIVDFQERFAPVIDQWERIVERTRILVRAAQELGLPILVTEQYPTGLGRTISSIADLFREGVSPYEKVTFSACGADGFEGALRQADVTAVLMAGIEAHVCVLQTALDLLDAGFDVFLAVDAISSRHSTDAARAIDRLRASGAVLVSTEMALFELLKTARHPRFKAVQDLIK